MLWGRVYFLVEARTLMMAAGVSHAVYSDDVDIADVEAFSLSGRFAKEIGLSPSTVELYFCVLYNILWDNKVRIQSYCGSFLKFNTC